MLKIDVACVFIGTHLFLTYFLEIEGVDDRPLASLAMSPKKGLQIELILFIIVP